ncbi:lasso peptide isopeptide bond-forming cyclase [Synechococcales cyanobacterium C]|uniref:asparagine synthase (glutamine-hydrolyzing) n=1 Tax=Petrachloros mirabilis ULC683 TaxID=2781853 RepID=A0A8K2A1K4_9CYAN|nr:lasso peptide isopeptide bond-forming cyclase [Petrachloros mirabilis]NCJ08143.1 lasso peptide isopeptide bond-forming cyclase [Petrachloros mirabilis ULC683]
MSAIAGLFYRNQQAVSPSDLAQMTQALAHRGPDGIQQWHHGSIGLGHCMLHTTPESKHEVLPLVSPGEDYVITADARIDNRKALMQALNIDPCSSFEISDSQLILKAYQRWGEQCLDYLIGDFAFAIWDKQQQHLFCARDHFGVKPFYYYLNDQSFIFGSEVKALLSQTNVPRQINEVRIGDYLLSLFEDTAITFYEDIWRLPPAHRLLIRAESVTLEPYWSLDAIQTLHLETDQAYADQFREIFIEAVSCRLRSAVPVGSMLSGGLDSSAITCTARHIQSESHQPPLPTFSAIFDTVKECDERFYINAVLDQGGFTPHYLHGDQRSPLTDIDQILWHQDEPLFSFNLFLNWGIYDIAHHKGVRVILDGFDGDSTISHGIGFFRELAIAGRWGDLIRELQGFCRNSNEPLFKWLWPFLWNFGFRKSRLIRGGQRIWRTITKKQAWTSKRTPPAAYPDTINPDLIKRLSLEQRLNAQKQAEIAALQSERAEHYRSLVRGVMPYTLEVLDKSAAAFGIEPRFPFWDKRLVEFCLSLPPEQKVRDGWTRMIMRRGLDGILPREVQWRGGKSNLGPNFRYIFHKFEQKRIQALLDDPPESMVHFFDFFALNQAYESFFGSDSKLGDDELWKALNLSLWLNKSVENKTSDRKTISMS